MSSTLLAPNRATELFGGACMPMWIACHRGVWWCLRLPQQFPPFATVLDSQNGFDPLSPDSWDDFDSLGFYVMPIFLDEGFERKHYKASTAEPRKQRISSDNAKTAITSKSQTCRELPDHQKKTGMCTPINSSYHNELAVLCTFNCIDLFLN